MSATIGNYFNTVFQTVPPKQVAAMVSIYKKRTLVEDVTMKDQETEKDNYVPNILRISSAELEKKAEAANEMYEVVEVSAISALIAQNRALCHF